MRKSLVLSIFFGLISLACSTEPQGTSFLFELEETGRYAVQMRDNDGTFLAIDTLDIQGDYAFSISFDTARIISFLPIEGDLPVVHAVVRPEAHQLVVGKDGFISGSGENNWMGEQRRMQLQLISFIDSLDAVKATYADSTSFKGLTELDSLFFDYADLYRQRVLDTLAANPAYLSNVMAVYHRIGQKPVIDYIIDRDLLRAVNDALQKSSPESPDAKAYKLWIDEFEETFQFSLVVDEAAEKFVEGTPFPEFTLETPQGELTNLPALSLDDHIVAVWASWCVPCRTELKSFAKGGTMDNWILLSLDGLPQQRSPLGEWYEAIATDDLGGLHLSDLGGSRSKITERLGIRELPVYFRVENGIITQRVNDIGALTR